MTELTLEVRAARAARRRNKKIAARYPLLAEQLAVTVESQVERLKAQDAANEDFFIRLSEGNERAWERAAIRKAVAMQIFTPQLFAEYELRFDRIYGRYLRKDTGDSAADWWWCALRDNNVPWCWDHCPNEALHNNRYHREKGYCPTCRKPLEPMPVKEPEPKQSELQLT